MQATACMPVHARRYADAQILPAFCKDPIPVKTCSREKCNNPGPLGLWSKLLQACVLIDSSIVVYDYGRIADCGSGW